MANEELYLDQEEVQPEFHAPFSIDLSDDPKHPQWKSNPHHQQDHFYASRRAKVAAGIKAGFSDANPPSPDDVPPEIFREYIRLTDQRNMYEQKAYDMPSHGDEEEADPERMFPAYKKINDRVNDLYRQYHPHLEYEG